MAKKQAINKSKAIRDACDANPSKSPSEIAALLVDQGLSVTPQYVSTIKSNAARKARGGKKRGGPRTVIRKKPTAAAPSGLGHFEAAVALIQSAGGIAEAKRVLDTVEQIRSL
ncbi:MAG: hypothetical protein KF774_00450 [Planctomyces sp.]|nr:hypothetical protein [Planctomyces sp.]